MRLLVIDDDSQNLKLVKFILANEGLEIHTASDPLAGMEQVRRLRPEVVLLDLVMPGVEGMEMLERIVDFDPAIDVILITGHYSTESAVEAIQKGASDYFPKLYPTNRNIEPNRVNRIFALETRSKSLLNNANWLPWS